LIGDSVNWLKKHWALPAALGLYGLLTGGIVIAALRANHGLLVYPLDDAYIHLAMAKHFAQNGVWGLTAQGFSSSTSSPLWTFLLSLGFMLFGVNASLALILGFCFGTALVTAGYFFLQKYHSRPAVIFVLLAAGILATPLPALTFTGMEHPLQALLTLGFVFCAAGVLAKPAASRTGMLLILVLAPLMTLTRFEGFFVLGLVVVLFAIQKRFGFGLLLAALGALPMVIYGLWSRAHGWFFLPNSVLLKGNWPGPSLVWYLKAFSFSFALENLRTCTHLFVLFSCSLGAAVLAGIRQQAQDERHWFNFIFIGAVFLHMEFANTGWFYRYEAYLVFLGVINLGMILPALWPDGGSTKQRQHPMIVITASLLGLTLLYPLGLRAFRSLREAPSASQNIFQQQYQIGLFLQKYYAHGATAVNDCGAVCFLSDTRILDIWGIGSLPIAVAKLARTYSSRSVEEMARRDSMDIALIYDSWLTPHGAIPGSWEKLGVWQIPNNLTCGDDTLSIYSLRPSGRETLLRNLQAFSAQLPTEVRQSGLYRETR
jgi:hypothetical protein